MFLFGTSSVMPHVWDIGNRAWRAQRSACRARIFQQSDDEIRARHAHARYKVMPVWWAGSSIRGGVTAGKELWRFNEPRQWQWYLRVVAIRPGLPASSLPARRLGCALRRVSEAVCVWEH